MLQNCIAINKSTGLYRCSGCVRRIDSVKPSATRVTLPVYLYATRTQSLLTLEFETGGEGSGKDHCFYERGVALISSTLGS
jgi:dynein heavy chain 1